MDILNGAIESLIGSSNREDWTPVALNVADATVTISKDKVRLTRTDSCVFPKLFFINTNVDVAQTETAINKLLSH